jgi:hypothetical protein
VNVRERLDLSLYIGNQSNLARCIGYLDAACDACGLGIYIPKKCRDVGPRYSGQTWG